MKKIVTISMIFELLSFLSYSQTQRQLSEPIYITMKDRYKFDYELVNESLLGADSSILNGITNDFLEEFRETNQDVVIRNEELNTDILIYSKNRVIASPTFTNVYNSTK